MNKNKVVAIIQARMGSSRLAGKVLKKINDTTLLEIQLNRIKRSELIDQIVIATSELEKDNAIFNLCKDLEIDCFRGSEKDVLARYFHCAKFYNADVVVRLTADCPLIDYSIADRVIDLFFKSSSDYAANTVPPESSKYPDGSDVEVFSMEALEQAYEEASSPEYREHVTFFFWRNKDKKRFKTSQLDNEKDWSEFRFTVDYPEDLEVVSFIQEELGKRQEYGFLHEIIQILESNPSIKDLNSKYYFGVGWNDE